MIDENEFNESYNDDKDFQARFILSPDIKEDLPGQFNHLDKNLAITNLRYKRNEINEPEQARAILESLHTLNNKVHYVEDVQTVAIGFQDLPDGDGVIIRKIVYEKQNVLVPKYPKTHHMLKARFTSFVVTSASANGHRMRSAITRNRVSEENINNRTKEPNKWGMSKDNR